MHESDKLPPHSTAAAAPARTGRSRPSTSSKRLPGEHTVDYSGRYPPSSVPHGAPLRCPPAEHRLSAASSLTSSRASSSSSSSSIALSSDTASASSPAANLSHNTTITAGQSSTATVAATAASSSTTARGDGTVPPQPPPAPFWWDTSTSWTADEAPVSHHRTANNLNNRNYTSVGSGCGGGVPSAAAAAVTTRSASVSLVPQEWRCSIDFSHEIESRAEAELQQLWTTLWCATHNEASLRAALQGPRTQWNPYRPVRGGAEVREEVLNSEVAEFREMVAVDSLYLQGTAVTPAAAPPRTSEAAAAADAAAAATSPHRPPRKSKKSRHTALAEKKEPVPMDEEVLVLDDSAVGASVSPLRGGQLATSAGEEAHYTEAWWAAHRADGEAALFRYLWETVVVPFYTTPSPSSSPSRAAFPSMTLDTTGVNVSLTLSHAEDRLDDRDASGMVTAFGPPREDKHNWASDVNARSPTPTDASTPLRGFGGGGGGGDHPTSPLARTQRSGCGPLLHSTMTTDIVSDDSIEVEVLDEHDGHPGQDLAEDEEERESATVAKLKREHTAAPAHLQPTRRNPPRRERPSTAGIQTTVFSPIEDVLPLGSAAGSATRDGGGGSGVAKQRARSARTDDAGTSAATTAAGAGSCSGDRFQPCARNSPQPVASARGWRLGKSPMLHTTVTDSAAERQLEAPATKPQSATRQRPPTAQPLASKSKRVASPHLSNTGSSAATHSNGEGQTSGRVASAAPPEEVSNDRIGSSSPPPANRRGHRGNALRVHPPTRQHTTTNTNTASGAVNHALQLLELRSRSASRSPFAPRVPSPFSGQPTTAADGTGKGRARPAPLLNSSVETTDVREAQRHGQLSPMKDAAPPGRRRRHNAKRGASAVHATTSTAAEEPTATAFLGPAGSERVMAKAKLAPLRETHAHTAAAQRAPLTEVPRGTSALGRTPSSSKTGRPGKEAPRTASAAKKASTKPRPTTAQK